MGRQKVYYTLTGDGRHHPVCPRKRTEEDKRSFNITHKGQETLGNLGYNTVILVDFSYSASCSGIHRYLDSLVLAL